MGGSSLAKIVSKKFVERRMKLNTEDIMGFIKAEIATVLNQDTDLIDEDANLLKIGVSSVQALKIINRIKNKLDIDINPIAMFEFKTISALAGYLNECMNEG